MKISSVKPEGGYQSSDVYTDQVKTLRAHRCPAMSMQSDDFLALCREHLHPRFCSMGLYVSEEMNKLREETMKTGLCGTMWFAGGQTHEGGPVITLGCMPYTSIRTKEWDEVKECWSLEGQMVKGWRITLETLIAGGFLKWHEDLSYLIGKDSFQIAPAKWQ